MTGQTENHVPRTCLLQDLQTVHCSTATVHCTHRDAVHHQEVLLGGSSILPLTTEGSWLHLKGVAKPLISPLMPVGYLQTVKESTS